MININIPKTGEYEYRAIDIDRRSGIVTPVSFYAFQEGAVNCRNTGKGKRRGSGGKINA